MPIRQSQRGYANQKSQTCQLINQQQLLSLSIRRKKILRQLFQYVNTPLLSKFKLSQDLQRLKKQSIHLDAQETKLIRKLQLIKIDNKTKSWSKQLCRRLIINQQCIIDKFNKGLSLSFDSLLNCCYSRLGQIINCIFKHYRKITENFYLQALRTIKISSNQQHPISKLKTQPQLQGYKIKLNLPTLRYKSPCQSFKRQQSIQQCKERIFEKYISIKIQKTTLQPINKQAVHSQRPIQITPIIQRKQSIQTSLKNYSNLNTKNLPSLISVPHNNKMKLLEQELAVKNIEIQKQVVAYCKKHKHDYGEYI